LKELPRRHRVRYERTGCPEVCEKIEKKRVGRITHGREKGEMGELAGEREQTKAGTIELIFSLDRTFIVSFFFLAFLLKPPVFKSHSLYVWPLG
jgi:hypothetical protein